MNLKVFTVALVVFAAVFYETSAASMSSGLARDGGHKEVVVPMDDKDHSVEVSAEDMGVDPDMISEVGERQNPNFRYCRTFKIWRWRRRICLSCASGRCNLTFTRA